MSSERQTLKSALRVEIRAKIAALADESRRQASEQLCERLKQSEIWAGAKSVLLFAPMVDEPDVWPLVEIGLREDKCIALPQFSAAEASYVAGRICDVERDVAVGKFGIREPIATCERHALDELDLVIVPAVAFDLRGHRLGRGKGFYDRILEHVRGVKCGAAWDGQIVDEIPFEPHDQRVNWLATPTRLMKTH